MFHDKSYARSSKARQYELARDQIEVFADRSIGPFKIYLLVNIEDLVFKTGRVNIKKNLRTCQIRRHLNLFISPSTALFRAEHSSIFHSENRPFDRPNLYAR